MEEIKNDREKKKVEGADIEVDKEVEGQVDALSILEQSEQAIERAGELLEWYEDISKDPEKRKVATGTSGVVIGGTTNYFLDAKRERDPEKRAELIEEGVTAMLEVAASISKTLIAGNRRRKAKLKRMEDEKVEVV